VNPGIVIAAAGHVDHARLSRLTAQHFRPEPGAEIPGPALSSPEDRHVAVFSEKDTEQYHVCLGGPGPRRADPERWAVFVADAILGGSWSSRLFQEVRERRGLAYSVYSYTSLYADAGLTAVYLGSREGAVGEALAVTLDVLARLPESITEEAVSRARNHLKGQLALSHESVTSRMQALGRSVLLELPVLSLDEMVAHVDAVTRDDVLAAVDRYYAPGRWSAVCIGPEAGPFRALTGDFTWEER